jgi:FtsH-binding integral membrane protein
MFIFYIVALVGLIPLYCCMRIFPVNMILLCTWTTIFAWAIGMICSVYNITTVLVAMGITTVTVVLLTAYVLISRAKLHWLGLFLGIASFVFTMTIMWTLVFSLFWRITPWWHMMLSGFGAFLFCLFILYDTSRILHTHHYDQWMDAAVTLYVDIITLFLYILSFITSLKRD